MSWFNLHGLLFVLIILIPNILFQSPVKTVFKINITIRRQQYWNSLADSGVLDLCFSPFPSYAVDFGFKEQILSI